ncbi:PROLINE-RICH PROTEIN PRCC [Salix koriyanagi]|uniref:PROLINE-RICH PROTEIN PRCC n=1 Tax=Salix koriyanagi TaxID=2511006 RepID=A0A9Q0ZUA6_9ROSI|nr:PROLINE-RICH PROTEIN PRCC [Salix koriyanagi]
MVVMNRGLTKVLVRMLLVLVLMVLVMEGMRVMVATEILGSMGVIGMLGSVAAVAETGGGGAVETAVRMMGKRRRNEIPTEIIEVKQDELIKNRPREDQVKSTGIAFGPAYQVLHLLLFVHVCGSLSLFYLCGDFVLLFICSWGTHVILH